MTEHRHRRSATPIRFHPEVSQFTVTAVTFLRGEGCCEEDPARSITAWYDPEGGFIAERDDHAEEQARAQLAACNEAYANNTTERDMYEIAYRDLRGTVKDALDPSFGAVLPPNLRARLEAVYNDGEVKPR